MNINLNKTLTQINYSFKELNLYLFSFIFIMGNLALPYLAHQFNLGGPRFLPIYFFVLIGAYKYGWKVGALTAILSPLVNNFLTGMPLNFMLPTIIFKGLVIAFIAYFIAKHTSKLSLTNLALVVLGYHFIGTLFEAVYLGNISKAVNDFIIAWPGLLIQIFGGYAVLRGLLNHERKIHAGDH